MTDKKYKIVEIFKSIQGEGYNFGKECIFIRFCGCNLKCPGCDTNVNDCNMELTKGEIFDICNEFACKNIILTGGEPTIQDLADLLKVFDETGGIGIETNGLNAVPHRIDGVSCSPKFKFRDIKLGIQARPNMEFRLVVDEDSEEYLKGASELNENYNGRNKGIRGYLSPCAKNDGVIGKVPEFDGDKLAHMYDKLRDLGFGVSIQVHKLGNKR